MPSNSAAEHEYFEQLCALAAIGDISDAEMAELQRHVRDCVSCRPLLSDFKDIVRIGVPAALEREPALHRARMVLQREGFRRRFFDKAARHGITFQSAFVGRPYSLGLAAAGAVAALIILCGILAVQLRNAGDRARAAEQEIAALTAKAGALQHRPVTQAPAGTRVPERVVTVERKIVPDPALQTQLALLRQQYDTAQKEILLLETELSGARSELETARSGLSVARQASGQSLERMRQSEIALRQANDELAKLRAARTTDLTAVAAHENQIRDLTAQLRSQSDAMDRETRLIAADRDIRELMGARSLHIVDVFDVDGKGKTNRPFGRVFYTEGKSLVFYAFDLNENKMRRANATFQAWGQRESRSESARSLGIFYVDDQKQNRWILKADDPAVLAQIDAVFVTVEPSGGSSKPNGQKLLYAYLNATPNHP